MLDAGNGNAGHDVLLEEQKQHNQGKRADQRDRHTGAVVGGGDGRVEQRDADRDQLLAGVADDDKRPQIGVPVGEDLQNTQRRDERSRQGDDDRQEDAPFARAVQISALAKRVRDVGVDILASEEDAVSDW